MANLTELVQYEAGVYQIETTDDVEGGAAGIANQQAKQLANRTAYLKNRLDALTAKNGSKNLLINGSFRIDERQADSLVPANDAATYVLDRWFAIHDAASVRTANVFRDSAVSAYVAGAFFAAAIDLTAGAGNFFFGQRVEGFWILDDCKATVSFWVLPDTAQDFDVTINGYKDAATLATGVPDYSLTEVIAAAGIIANEANFCSVTFDIPSLAAFAAGITTDDGVIEMLIQPKSAAATYTQIANVQFERGDTASDFIAVPYAEDLINCQRYGERIVLVHYDEAIDAALYLKNENVPFAVKKRIAPALVVDSPPAGTNGAQNITLHPNGKDRFRFTYDNNNHTVTALREVQINMFADAEI